MDPTSYSFLRVERRGAIALATLNRPEALNACDKSGHSEMSRFLRELARDPELRVGVLTGAGRAFSPGGDQGLVDSLNRDPAMRAWGHAEARELVYAHIDCDKPVICALNGLAMGAGAAYALLCDVIVAERQAKISDAHVRAAIAAGDGGTIIWPLSVGLVRAKRFLLTGDWLTAQEAERIGLVTEVVEQGASLARAMEYAERLAAGPQTAIRYTKRALNMWLRSGAITAFDLSVAYEFDTIGSAEATQAFGELRERRPGPMPPETVG